jgi:hypothetical protein
LSGGGAEVGGQILLSGGASDGNVIFKTSLSSSTATEVMRIRETGAVEIKGSSTTSQAQAFITNDNSVLTIGSSVSGSVVKDIAFNSPSTMMYIDGSTASVGINTSSPTSYANSQATLVIQDTGSPAIAWSDTGQSKDWFAVAQGSGLYFNYADGGGSGGASNVTDVLVLDNSGNVGIGVSSPSEKLEVNGNIFVNTSGNPVITNKTSGAGNNPVFRLQADTNKWDIQGTFSNANDHLFFMYNSSTKMAITSGGLVGIGQTSPNVPLEIQSATPAVMLTDSDTGNSGVIEQDGTDLYYGNSSSSGTHIFKNNSSNRGRPSVNGNELMRIDSSGNLLVGTTNTNPAENNTTGASILGGGDGRLLVCVDNNEVAQFNRKTTDGTILVFRQNAVARGSVSISGANTSYNTTSDARLKDVTGEARGLEVINELNPVAYNWKESGQADEGLIAQEVMDIVPNAVSGSEEEMYQMDYSKLVVHLVAGMKEQQTIIDDLKTRIETLEG